jgi:hypothetical protein
MCWWHELVQCVGGVLWWHELVVCLGGGVGGMWVACGLVVLVACGWHALMAFFVCQHIKPKCTANFGGFLNLNFVVSNPHM